MGKRVAEVLFLPKAPLCCGLLSPEMVGIGDPQNLLLKQGATSPQSGHKMRCRGADSSSPQGQGLPWGLGCHHIFGYDTLDSWDKDFDSVSPIVEWTFVSQRRETGGC